MSGPETRWRSRFRFSIYDGIRGRIGCRRIVATVLLEWDRKWHYHSVAYANCHGDFSWVEDVAGLTVEARDLASKGPKKLGFCGVIRASNKHGMLIAVDAGRCPIGRMLDLRGPGFGFYLDTSRLESIA